MTLAGVFAVNKVCNICSCKMTDDRTSLFRDCGGDCLQCMAEAGDPDCIKQVRQLKGATMALNSEGGFIETVDGMYGSYAYRREAGKPFWVCQESSDYRYVAVVDDFGQLVPVSHIENLRGY